MNWTMIVSIGNRWNDHSALKIIPIITKTQKHSEALNEALTWLKRSASQSKPTKRYSTITLTPYRKKGLRRECDLYRGRAWYRTPYRIRSIKEPKELFVQGYGPKILDEVFKKFRQEMSSKKAH